jgi:hypothetical protein
MGLTRRITARPREGFVAPDSANGEPNRLNLPKPAAICSGVRVKITLAILCALALLQAGCVRKTPSTPARQFRLDDTSSVVERAWKFVDDGLTNHRRKDLQLHRVQLYSKRPMAGVEFYVTSTLATNRPGEMSVKTLTIFVDSSGSVISTLSGKSTQIDSTQMKAKAPERSAPRIFESQL